MPQAKRKTAINLVIALCHQWKVKPSVCESGAQNQSGKVVVFRHIENSLDARIIVWPTILTPNLANKCSLILSKTFCTQLNHELLGTCVIDTIMMLLD